MQVRSDLDPARRAVLADWLNARGDPRGELLMLELLLESHPPGEQRSVLAQRLAKLRGDLEQRWVLELAQQLSLTPAQLHAFLPGRWYAGLLLECCLCPTAELANSEVAPVLLEWILDSEAAVALEVLDAGELVAPTVVEQLATRAPLPHLRHLVLGDYRNEIGPLESLSTQLPALRELELRGRGPNLEGLELAQLERLHLHFRGDGIVPLEQLAAQQWPTLTRLELRFDQRPYTGYGNYTILDVASLAGLLTGRATPALRALELSSFECRDEHIRVLAASQLLTQLEHLSLSDVVLALDAQRTLVTHADAFARLTRFELNLGTRDFIDDRLGRPSSVLPSLYDAYPRLNLG